MHARPSNAINMQDAGEDEAGAGEPEAAAVYEVGMRKSARTEQIDFKQREEERWVMPTSQVSLRCSACTHRQPA